MLPGLRLVTAAIAVAILLVVLGIGEMAKLRVAQSQSANLPASEARFAGLAFAERANWTPPDTTSKPVSLESLPPFAEGPTTSEPTEAAATAADVPIAVKSASLAASEPEKAASPAPPAEERRPAAASTEDVAPAEGAAASQPIVVVAIDPAPLDMTPGPVRPADPAPTPAPAVEARAAPPPIPDTTVLPANPRPAPVAVASTTPVPATLTVKDTTAPAIPLAEVKLPVPRPAVVRVANTQAKIQSRAKMRRSARAARKPALPAHSNAPASAESGNPLAQLLGGSRPAATTRN